MEKVLEQLLAEFRRLNDNIQVIADHMSGSSSGVTKSTKKPVAVKYVAVDSPFASKEFPRKSVRPLREDEQADYTFDSVADAVMDVFQHGTVPEDIDVFLPDGSVVTGIKYLS